MDEQTKIEILFEGAKEGNLAVVNEIIRKGADVNVKSNEGWTALMGASVGGHTDAAKLLIEKGADVNVKANEDVTALMSASYKGHTDIVSLLRNAGARE